MGKLTSTIGLTLFIAIVVWQFLPYPPRAPLNEPALLEARALVTAIASTPHPQGSPQNAHVRNHLLEVLRGIGLAPEVQRATVVLDHPKRGADRVHIARVENIWARIEGTGTGPALLLMCHYDSRANAPGASDGAAGVSAVIAAASALIAGPKPVHDVIVLINDGEETGLFGAQAFFTKHPAASTVGLVLNFEARGSSGAVNMFETSDGNAGLVREFAKVAQAPLASSISYEIYQRMPNDTDLTIAKAAGAMGMNFAFIDDFFDYHAATDHPNQLNADTLSHMLQQSIAVASRFAHLENWPGRQDNATYFSLPGGIFIQYGIVLVYIAGVVTLFFGFWQVTASIRRQSSIESVLRGIACSIVPALIIVSALAALVSIYTARDMGQWHYFYRHKALLLGYTLSTVGFIAYFYAATKRGLQSLEIGLLLAALAVSLALRADYDIGLLALPVVASLLYWLRQPVPTIALQTGGSILWLSILAITLIAVPHASYLMVWPLSLVLMAHWLGRRYPKTLWFWHALAVTVTLALWVPLIYLGYLGIGIGVPHYIMLLFVFLLALIVPLIQRLAQPPWITGIIVGIGTLVITYALVIEPFNFRHRKPEDLFYALDVNRGQGYWASENTNIAPWFEPLFTSDADGGFNRILPGNDRPLHLTPTLPILWRPATLVDIQIDRHPDRSHYTMELRVPSQAENIRLLFPPETTVLTATVDGQMLDLTSHRAGEWKPWHYTAPPPYGSRISFTVTGNRPVRIRLVELKYGWPSDIPTPQRPGDSMPSPNSWSDRVVAWQDITL